MRAWLRRGRDERGTALVELVWLGILLLVPMVYILISVFEVQRGAFAVNAAARSAGRAFAVAPDDAAGERAARTAARLALTDQGIDGGALDLELRCEPAGACRAPGSTVVVLVRSRVDLPLLPDALGGQKPAVALDATHRVPYGRYNLPDAGGAP